MRLLIRIDFTAYLWYYIHEVICVQRFAKVHITKGGTLFMKRNKLTLIIMMLILVLALSACGKSDAVKNVEAEINALQTITIDSRSDIEKAQADYDALSDKEKKQVENVATLDSAKEELLVIEQVADTEEKIATAATTPSEDTVTAAKAAYDGLSEDAKGRVKNYADLESAEAALALRQEVAAALDGCTWYFNGGENTILNAIEFTSDSATISQVSFDGNGKHDNGSNEYAFSVSAENILVSLPDGSNLEIPYKMDGSKVAIGNGEYYTIEEIDAAIQGCWNMRDSSTILGMKTVTDKSILFENGKVTSEKASLANGSTSGEYYYYGPYTGTYKLNFGGLDTDMSHGNEWFFNIIDGKVVIINYDHVCSPSNGLPGENGYSFN